MRVQSMHSRILDASPGRVATLLASLGTDRDELWPADRWPACVEFDRTPAAGARGGHGLIRYVIEEYDPERRIVFRFEPGQGLDGIHRFDVESLADERTRLVHTLDARLDGAIRLVSPALLRMHDRTIEDVLDRAEQATAGRAPDRTRLPVWMRALNVVEARMVQRRSVTNPPPALAGER
ncbi:MAG TPA: hypothetical protein VE270_03585 [Thermoleophilaceae bacterium]|nr:hypothetical protein [Thermoleophilaceae bacterium]